MESQRDQVERAMKSADADAPPSPPSSMAASSPERVRHSARFLLRRARCASSRRRLRRWPSAAARRRIRRGTATRRPTTEFVLLPDVHLRVRSLHRPALFSNQTLPRVVDAARCRQAAQPAPRYAVPSRTEEALCRGAGRPLAELLLHVRLHHRFGKVRSLERFGVEDRLRERRALGLGVCQDRVLEVGALEGRAREVGAAEVGPFTVGFEEARAAQGRLLEGRVDGVGAAEVLVVEFLAVKNLILDRPRRSPCRLQKLRSRRRAASRERCRRGPGLDMCGASITSVAAPSSRWLRVVITSTAWRVNLQPRQQMCYGALRCPRAGARSSGACSCYRDRRKQSNDAFLRLDVLR